MPSVMVIGAGIAGLACGWRLKQAGWNVQVFEANTVAGGRMRSERHGDFLIDRGAQFIASGYRNLHALAAELGLAHRVRSVGRTSNAILRNGILHPGDYDHLRQFVASRLLSSSTKLRLGLLGVDLLRYRRLLDPRRPELAAAIDSESMSDYLRRRVGNEALEFLLGPALSSTFDSDPEDLSAAFLWLALRFVLSGFRLQSFDSGTGLLTATLAERLEVLLDHRAESLRSTDDGVELQIDGPRGPQAHWAEAAVIAVPGTRVLGICSELSAAEREFFGSVRYVRGIIVFLMTERAPMTLPYYGVAFPRPEGLELYGLAVDHHKAGAAPAGAGLLNTALTAAAADRVWDWSDNRIVDLVLDNLARTPIGRLSPSQALVHRWDPMLPQFYAGYLPRLRRFLDRPDATPRLHFCGDYLVGPYTEAALTSGLRAAASVRAQNG